MDRPGSVAALAVFTALLAIGCAIVRSNPPEHLAGTWERRFEVVPVGPRPLPVVLFLHGCAGLNLGDTSVWARVLSAQGYAVVAPDSFARPGRRQNCDPTSSSGGAASEVHDFRLEEVGYALARLRELPWVDQRRIFLMGHSEGGIAAARWDKPGFRGVIISGWTCTSTLPEWRSLHGLWTPKGTPVLSIVHDDDPWFRRSHKGNCSTWIDSRPQSRSVTLPGTGHATSANPEAVQGVTDFLDRLR